MAKRNRMGDGWTVAKNESGRTVYTSADGLFRVRATGTRLGSGYSPWCVEHGGRKLYASSLADASRVVAQLRRGGEWWGA